MPEVRANTDLLRAEGLTAHYGEIRALDDVSFMVRPGEIIAMIGPNGAGKSTALKAVCGLLPDSDGCLKSGRVIFSGREITNHRPDQLVGIGITLVPEGRRVFRSLSVMENLQMGGYTLPDRKAKARSIDRLFGLFPRLRERAKQAAGLLSTGEQQMLSLARALVTEPRLLLVDEPSVGLSPNFVDAVYERLAEIAESGTGVLLVDQNAAMALSTADRAYVFDSGRIPLEGPVAELKGDRRIQEVYLGGAPSQRG